MGDIIEFETHRGHERIFYKITNSAISFEVKAAGNAVIGLARKAGPRCDYLVTIGDNLQQSWIKKITGSHSKEKVDTPNILSREDYKRFWVSWYGETIRLGGDGHVNPIVAYKNYPTTDLKYVTFSVLKNVNNYNLAGQQVQWKVELPPVLEKPIMKSFTSGEPYWVPIDTDTTSLPNGAAIGGYEKENLYVIRAKHRGSLTPGKFIPSEGIAYISWGGDAIAKNTFEVLCGFNCKWVPTSKDRIPVGAIIGGQSENIEHEKLYIGRAKYLNNIIPGKVQPSHKVCYICYDGNEIAVNNYEILVNPEKNRSANSLLVPPPFDEYVSDGEQNDDDFIDRESESDEDEVIAL